MIFLSYIAMQQKLFKGKDQELSVIGRLAAGACAGMTSTLVIVEHFILLWKSFIGLHVITLFFTYLLQQFLLVTCNYISFIKNVRILYILTFSADLG